MITPGAAEVIVRWKTAELGLLGMDVILGRSAKRNTAPMTAKVVNTVAVSEEFGQERLQRCIQRIFAANARLKT